MNSTNSLGNQQTNLFDSINRSINPFAATTKLPTEGNREDIKVEIGASNCVIDGFRNLSSIPMKILLLNSEINSGNVSEETIEKMKDYLHQNGLHDVSISICQYKPQEVWHRIFTNPKTSTLSKFTFGIAEGLLETFAFSKLTGFPGDHYSPAQNTVHLFSNDLSIALHECGHAKDLNERENPTLYSATRLLPKFAADSPSTIFAAHLPTLYQEFTASKNATDYFQAEGGGKNLKNAYKILVPAFATYASGALYASYFSDPAADWATQSVDSYKIILVGVLVGHIAGRVMASMVAATPAPTLQRPDPMYQQELKNRECSGKLSSLPSITN